MAPQAPTAICRCSFRPGPAALPSAAWGRSSRSNQADPKAAGGDAGLAAEKGLSAFYSSPSRGARGFPNQAPRKEGGEAVYQQISSSLQTRPYL